MRDKRVHLNCAISSKIQLFRYQKDDLTLDVDITRLLKSKSWSVDQITATLAQSDRVYVLLNQYRHNPNHYRKQVTKYIYSVGTKADLTFDNYGEKNKSPHRQNKQKKSSPEIER